MIVITLVSAAILVLIDQILKLIVSLNVSPNDIVTIIPHILDVTYVENNGAAFGIMQGFTWLFSVITLLVVAGFIYIIVTKKINNKLFCMSAILIMGGAVGNLIDRIFRGYVIDYLQLSFFSPICNFADYCLTVGAALLIIYIIFYYNPKDKKDKVRS